VQEGWLNVEHRFDWSLMRNENVDCFHELGSDRGRHLIRMENNDIFMTSRRREGAVQPPLLHTKSVPLREMIAQFCDRFFVVVRAEDC